MHSHEAHNLVRASLPCLASVLMYVMYKLMHSKPCSLKPVTGNEALRAPALQETCGALVVADTDSLFILVEMISEPVN